jgi:hypothetical protein
MQRPGSAGWIHEPAGISCRRFPGLCGAVAACFLGIPFRDIVQRRGSMKASQSRKLVIDDPKDVQFDNLAREYVFGVAVFDNAQIEHSYSFMPLRLAFER